MELNENAKKWIAALRSGQYEQTQGQLCEIKKDGSVAFCCLGVACDIYIKEGHELKTKDDESSRLYHESASLFVVGELPQCVKDWLGLRSSLGYIVDYSLVRLNDGEHMSFEQIADVIESKPKGLFSEPTPAEPSETDQSQSEHQS